MKRIIFLVAIFFLILIIPTTQAVKQCIYDVAEEHKGSIFKLELYVNKEITESEFKGNNFVLHITSNTGSICKPYGKESFKGNNIILELRTRTVEKAPEPFKTQLKGNNIILELNWRGFENRSGSIQDEVDESVLRLPVSGGRCEYLGDFKGNNFNIELGLGRETVAKLLGNNFQLEVGGTECETLALLNTDPQIESIIVIPNSVLREGPNAVDVIVNFTDQDGHSAVDFTLELFVRGPTDRIHNCISYTVIALNQTYYQAICSIDPEKDWAMGWYDVEAGIDDGHQGSTITYFDENLDLLEVMGDEIPPIINLTVYNDSIKIEHNQVINTTPVDITIQLNASDNLAGVRNNVINYSIIQLAEINNYAKECGAYNCSLKLTFDKSAIINYFGESIDWGDNPSRDPETGNYYLIIYEKLGMFDTHELHLIIGQRAWVNVIIVNPTESSDKIKLDFIDPSYDYALFEENNSRSMEVWLNPGGYKILPVRIFTSDLGEFSLILKAEGKYSKLFAQDTLKILVVFPAEFSGLNIFAIVLLIIIAGIIIFKWGLNEIRS